MIPFIQLKQTTSIFLLAFALACFAFSEVSRAQCPSSCDSNENTAFGADALAFNSGSLNTAVGYGAAARGNSGNDNTALGRYTLGGETSGANGNSGNYNTAVGSEAMAFNQTGSSNTATGRWALVSNNTGNYNTATGTDALRNSFFGNYNTANGYAALFSNTTGNYNTADGVSALLSDTTGSQNVAIGVNAGRALTTGSGNVCIGVNVFGVAGESNTTRIKNVYTSVATARAVYVNSDNKIGTLASSRRFKEEIKAMGTASEAILALKPVTFRYKKEIDAAGVKQFGLVAEDVERVNPDLVTRDEEGKPETVRYDQVNAMLLNEFLKEHRTVQELKSNAVKQEATIARLEQQIEALTAGLHKMSAQLELSRPAPQTVKNNN